MYFSFLTSSNFLVDNYTSHNYHHHPVEDPESNAHHPSLLDDVRGIADRRAIVLNLPASGQATHALQHVHIRQDTWDGCLLDVSVVI